MSIQEAILEELKEIRKVLQTIASSKEHEEIMIDGKKVAERISKITVCPAVVTIRSDNIKL